MADVRRTRPDLADAAEAAQAMPPRILVVEDDPGVRGTVQRYLRLYDVDFAECIGDAITRLAARTYDLLLLDRQLPDGVGDHVIDEVHRRGYRLPILMMSGEVQPQRDGRPLSRADDFIEKPFVREALIVRIERLLIAHELREQTARQQAELAEHHARREREVDVARTIFDRIFARGEFEPPNVRHMVRAADRLAGDVVFGASIGEGRYRWMIGDVTGHTLSSALVTMPLAGIFYRTAKQLEPIPTVLIQIERELASMLPAHMFCAAAICELDRSAGTLEAWNGGIPDLLIRHASGELTRIPSMTLPLAADRFAPPSHTTATYPVAHGDRIYAFSDGLIELRDGAQRMIGFDRLLDIAGTSPPDAIFDRFLACIPDGALRDDDVSLIEVVV